MPACPRVDTKRIRSSMTRGLLPGHRQDRPRRHSDLSPMSVGQTCHPCSRSGPWSGLWGRTGKWPCTRRPGRGDQAEMVLGAPGKFHCRGVVVAQHPAGEIERAADQDAASRGRGRRWRRRRRRRRRRPRPARPAARAAAAVASAGSVAASPGIVTAARSRASAASGRRKPSTSLVLSMPQTRCSGRGGRRRERLGERLAGGRVVAAVEPELGGAGGLDQRAAAQALQPRRPFGAA